MESEPEETVAVKQEPGEELELEAEHEVKVKVEQSDE